MTKVSHRRPRRSSLLLSIWPSTLEFYAECFNLETFLTSWLIRNFLLGTAKTSKWGSKGISSLYIFALCRIRTYIHQSSPSSAALKKWYFKQTKIPVFQIDNKTEVCVARQRLWWFDLIISANQQAKSFKQPKSLIHVRSTWATRPLLFKALVQSILLQRPCMTHNNIRSAFTSFILWAFYLPKN